MLHSRVPPPPPRSTRLSADAGRGAADPPKPRLTTRAHDFLRSLGCSLPLVAVEIGSHGSVASALGATLGSVSVGRICVGEELLAALDAPTLDFVLAHEAAHIWLNHSVAAGALVRDGAALDRAACHGPGLREILAVYDRLKRVVFAREHARLDALVTRTEELAADAAAACLVGDVDAAHRALLTLARGDRSAPSHAWEVFHTSAPEMSVGERLTALDARFGISR